MNRVFASLLSRQKLITLTIGTDDRNLFTPSSSALLERAFGAREITLLNLVRIHSKNSGKPFYAILHRIDVGIKDLEHARKEDPALSIAGVVRSTAACISRLMAKLRYVRRLLEASFSQIY